jgi:hypothetical protein
MRVRHPKAVTEWERPDLMLPSQYGTITYRNWCQKEVETEIIAIAR